MYISHKYKFIFLRVPKTASSSLSEFFIKNIDDPHAIYTPVEDSKIQGTAPFELIKKYKNNFKYYHFTLQELVDEKIITAEQARTYKCVAVLRDPIDRQKSFYYFYKKWKSRSTPVGPADYNRLAPTGWFSGEPNSAIRQTDILKFENKIQGEYWLYEHIDSNINKLMSEFNLPIKHELPNHKSEFRKGKPSVTVFDERALTAMKQHFTEDFELYEVLKNGTNESVYT